METTAYPKPDRSDLRPNLERRNPDDVVDLGWNEGTFSDGRPYRVENWQQKDLLMLTYFFSTKDIEGLSTDDLRHYLEEENVVVFPAPEQFVAAQKITDPSGNELWSVNVLVTAGDISYAEDRLPLHPYT